MSLHPLVTLAMMLLLSSLDGCDCGRVRRLAANENAKMSFDFNLLVPVPVMGSMDVQGVVEVPVSVSLTNESFNWAPVTLPYFVMANQAQNHAPAALPVPFPAVFHAPEEALKYLKNHQHPHQIHYLHQVVKRQASEVSARHRSEFLSGLASLLEELGLDGTSCISKFICQLARAPLLPETVIHEIISHLLAIPTVGETPLDSAFVEASSLGSRGGDCDLLYENCSLDLFSLHGVEQ